jgi:hypothetical protein
MLLAPQQMPCFVSAAAVFFREPSEVVEGACGLLSTVAVVDPEIAVQGINDEQAGVGFLKCILEYGRVAKAERRRARSATG